MLNGKGRAAHRTDFDRIASLHERMFCNRIGVPRQPCLASRLDRAGRILCQPVRVIPACVSRISSCNNISTHPPSGAATDQCPGAAFAEWDFLVNPIMREGGYVRYDFSKSDQILRDCQKLVDEYDGSLWEVHETALDANDLESRLRAFYGVGPVTANIFLRELRPFWPKADPSLLPVAVTIATSLGTTLGNMGERRLPSPGSKPASFDGAASIVGMATAPNDVTRPAIDERKVARRRRVG
jgi:hypothetical protein